MSQSFYEEIPTICQVLESEGTILYPTDTIWGLGCDATSQQAVEKTFRIKERNPLQSMLILATDFEMIRHYVQSIPETVRELLENSDKPVTIIYPHAINLPDNLVGSDGSIGIRIPQDDFCLEVLRSFQKPIVSTSANFSGKPFPRHFHEIDSQLIKLVDYVCRHKQDETFNNPPSAIYKIAEGGELMVIRK